MLLLLIAMTIFFFLLVGAVVYLAFVLIPPLRKYALSAALWCATLGPTSVALMLAAGTTLAVGAFIMNSGHSQWEIAPKLLSTIGWGYLVLGTLLSACFATAVAWLHQVIVRRFTFALFRLYASAVSAGIGSVFGWSVSWWMLSKQIPYGWLFWIPLMLALILVFGAAAYKGARRLRGEAPTNFTWISQDEYAGT